MGEQAKLLSVQVGKPKEIDEPAPWVSSIFKAAVGLPVFLQMENLDGNEQADLRVHGGPDKAICVYSADNYPYWRQDWNVPMIAGGFGENFTTNGHSERDVCIGDTYRVGEAIVQVSQPRGPCWKLGQRWNRPDLPKLVVASGKTGWYFRTIKPGYIHANQELTLIDRSYPQWTVAVVNDLTYKKGQDREAVAELASCDALARSWRASLQRR